MQGPKAGMVPQALAPAFSGQGNGTRRNAWCVLSRCCLLQPVSPTACRVSDPSQEISVVAFLLPSAPEVLTPTPALPLPLTGAAALLLALLSLLSGWFLFRPLWF